MFLKLGQGTFPCPNMFLFHRNLHTLYANLRYHHTSALSRKLCRSIDCLYCSKFLSICGIEDDNLVGVETLGQGTVPCHTRQKLP